MNTFGSVTRQDLLQLAETVGAQSEIPRLVRRLIQETGRGVIKLGMPAGEGVASSGWDGTVVATEATLFIPAGLSVWELSVEKGANAKADKDYEKRKTTPDGSPTNECTYVEAILRQWTKRGDWANARTAEKTWKAVRAYGVDDIDTWLEGAPITRAWLARLLGRNPYGLEPLELWWEKWAASTTPAMSPAVVLAGRDEQKKKLLERLGGPGQVTSIKATSIEEARAFIAATMLENDEPGTDGFVARAALIDDVGTWRELLARTSPLILIQASDQIDSEPAPGSPHHIIVPVIDATSADIELPPIEPSIATAALKAVGVEDQQAENLGRLGRRSLLAMRREIANKRELHEPDWAKASINQSIRGILLAGKWDEGRDGDKAVLAELACTEYATLSEQGITLAAQADPFVSKVDGSWALVSAFDAWRMLAKHVQPADLVRLKTVVINVLGERDPSLDLPKDDRWWRAGFEGKVPSYSGTLRRGLAGTIALLGALGEDVAAGLGSTGADWAAGVVKQLLDAANADIKGDIWISLSDILPLLAEAAPDAFLDHVEKALKGDEPLMLSMFKAETDGGGIGGHAPHTGLLWALEGVSWAGPHFGRAVAALARLAEIDPGGRLGDRPAASLAAIFRPWHPDTSVDVNRRIVVLNSIATRYPKVTRQLMLTMLPETHGVHFPIHEPSFRAWKPAKISVTYPEYFKVVSDVATKLAELAGKDAALWVELLEHLSILPPTDRNVVLARLEEHNNSGDFAREDKAKLWEVLRSTTASHREFHDASWPLPEEELKKIERVQDQLKPTGSMELNQWLFQDWTPDLPGVTRRGDYTAYDAAVMEARKNAAASIEADGGFDALIELSRKAKQSWWVGVATADATESKYQEKMLALVESEDRVMAELAGSYVSRRFIQAGWPWAEKLLADKCLSATQHAALLLRSADYPKAWKRADELGEQVAAEFWKRFSPFGLGDFKHTTEAAKRLMAVDRNTAALELAELYMRKDQGAVVPLLKLAAEALENLLNKDDPGARTLSNYVFDDLFARFYEHKDAIGWKQIAHLEWAYLPALGYDAKPRMLNELMSRDPDFFVEIVSVVYRPNSAEDPPTPTPDEVQKALNGHHLLDDWTLPPGAQADGTINPSELASWMVETVKKLKAADRLRVGLHRVGEMLSRVPAGADGGWPIQAVRDVIETQHDEELESGFYIGVLNGRGVVTRSPGDGGVQERGLAASYQELAEKYSDAWPRTATILRALADNYNREARREDNRAERFKRGIED